jgi:glutamate-ammonia-ligase adenylyltransferase
MPADSSPPGWIDRPPLIVAPDERETLVRSCSYFAAGLLDLHPGWLSGLEQHPGPQAEDLQSAIAQYGLDPGLRRYRNHQMLRIIWNDLCGLASLATLFSDLTTLAEVCLQAAIDAHTLSLHGKYGKPRSKCGQKQRLFVLGMGKFGGRELNLSSDIDVIFCYPESGECDGHRKLDNDLFFARLARAVINSLSEITEHGFCFRVDARLRPFGDSGPLTSSMAAMEQYYQREGRDWERYALIKARPVAGDLESARQLLSKLRPFVYRRYIDFGSVEALQEMHSNVSEDARRKDRLDDIKRGPGGIREIEFLAQSFQLLRGGRETSLQTPSLDQALLQIETLKLMSREAVAELRLDYTYLRRLENRIQALRDQQTHRLPGDPDLAHIARAMGEEDPPGLHHHLAQIRQRVSTRFTALFPNNPVPTQDSPWSKKWRQMQQDQQGIDPLPNEHNKDPLEIFLRQMRRFALSQRAHRRLNQFMPVLLEQIDRQSLDPVTLNRVLDLVLAICRRSAYLVLLVQHPPALDRVLDLFERSEWLATRVIRFPALLDELIDPSLGQQIPSQHELTQSVARLSLAAQDVESVLEGLNYLKRATSLQIAVAQIKGSLSGEQAQAALSGLAAAILKGVADVASQEITARHGRLPALASDNLEDRSPAGNVAIIAYGTLGANELGYRSDLDIVFLFEDTPHLSDGKRPLPAERLYARMAQRVLSFLTVTTPSGRLYEVDTRLRPNGRAGSLVSSLRAFSDYQLNEAWTWEMQALTRARFITGNHSLKVRFERIRQAALCRRRSEDELRVELHEMREKMRKEKGLRNDRERSAKHGSGGLVDIEFIAQLGILSSAQAFPRLLQASSTLAQLAELRAIGWLNRDEAGKLEGMARELGQYQMMSTLLGQQTSARPDTLVSAEIYQDKFKISQDFS